MEFARKFRLVPADRDQEFIEEHLSDLDKQIQSILKRKINDDEKAKLYAQLLQKFVSFPDVNSVQAPKEQVPEESPENTFDAEKEILNSAPVKHKKTASKIIQFFKEHNISWNQDKEIIMDKETIPGSDIVEIVNFLLRDKIKKPNGYEEFNEKLQSQNFPQHLMKNKYLSDFKMLYAKPKLAPKRKLLSRNLTSEKWLKL